MLASVIHNLGYLVAPLTPGRVLLKLLVCGQPNVLCMFEDSSLQHPLGQCYSQRGEGKETFEGSPLYLRVYPGSCTYPFHSYPLSQNCAIGLYLKEARQCRLHSGKYPPC